MTYRNGLSRLLYMSYNVIDRVIPRQTTDTQGKVNYGSEFSNIKWIQNILAGNQPKSCRVVPSSPAGKIIYWSPEFG
jgi:hypothetical protein